MPATNPTAARRPPTCAPALMAELEVVDDVVDVVDDGLDLVVLDREDELEGGEPLEAEATAVAWNFSNVSFVVGLMANTMPPWQCLVSRQYHHVGEVSLTVMVNENVSVEGKPESMPPSSARHGAVKFDCVTVWSLEEKVNVTVSLASAVTLVGL